MAEKDRKYPTWGNFLKKKRASKYRSARDFCARVSVGISYPQYSRYEAGDQLPNFDQALILCRLLDIPLLEGVLEWCAAQTSNEGVVKELHATMHQVRANELIQSVQQDKKEQFGQDGLFDNPDPSSKISLNEVIVFNRSHLKLFSSDPRYRDVFTYINSFEQDRVSVFDIGSAFEIPVTEIRQMVKALANVGIILLDGDECQASKKIFYFPDDDEFFDLRNSNLRHNLDSVLAKLTFEDLADRKAYRIVVTRELTDVQTERVIQGLERVVHQVTKEREVSGTENVYSLCLLFGKHFSKVNASSKPNELTPMGLTLGDSKKGQASDENATAANQPTENS